MEKLRKKRSRLRNLRNSISLILLLLGLIIFLSADWYKIAFSDVTLDQLIFHLKVPLTGANDDFFLQYINYIKPYLGDIFILFIIVAIMMSPCFKHSFRITGHIKIGKKQFNWHWTVKDSTTYLVWINVLVFISSIIYGAKALDLGTYIHNNLNASSLYEDYYVDPKKANLTFPEEKRNLIYIFLESMESSYANVGDLNIGQDNLIPGLEEIALDNINFSHNDSLGGAQTIYGTTWTVAAMVAQTSGVPLNIPIDGNTMNQYSTFLPGVYSLGEILKDNGYRQYLMLGSDSGFGGRSNYFKQHGDYNIYDYYSAIDDGKIDEDYFVWWGYEDAKLFDYAKEKLLELADDDTEQPFNFTMLTADTHATEGYKDETCTNPTSQSYANSVICSDSKVSEFVKWIQEQDFYEDTTIVIVGDHLVMGNYLFPASDSRERSIYNAFINVDTNVDYQNTKNRTFTVFDMYPTTLASLGVKIKGNRLGLGTNLFSEKPTLAEELGLNKLDAQLQRKSNYYNHRLLY